jgi:hypothetical protein
MMGMIENMLSPLVDKVDIVLFGQAAQSGSLPDLTEKNNILSHTQNCLVPNSVLNHINCKFGLYVFIQHILGLDSLAAFIHVNKAIDKTLLLASQGTVDDYPMRERQLAALEAVKPALEQSFPLPKKQRKCNADDTAVTVADTDTDTDIEASSDFPIMDDSESLFPASSDFPIMDDSESLYPASSDFPIMDDSEPLFPASINN